MTTVDRRAAELAIRQLGLATRTQLRDVAGVSASSTARRLRAGSWSEPLPNVIDLGTHRPDHRSEALSLVLAAGPDAAWASHHTAAWLHGFLDARPPRTPDVIVPRGRHARVGPHRLHTARGLGDDEVTQVAAVPCTTPERTLVDLASRTAPGRLERYLADLERRRPGRVGRVVELLDRHRHTPGRRRLLEVVARLPGGASKLGSPLEVEGVVRLRELGAPSFVLQHVVRDASGARIKRVDVAWPDRGVVLEFDGVAYHDLTEARAADEITRRRLRAAGWHVEVVRRRDLHAPRFAAFVRRLGDGSTPR